MVDPISQQFKKKQTGFRTGLMLIPCLLPCILLGWGSIVIHLGPGSFGEDALAEPYYTWIQSFVPWYWFFSIGGLLILFFILYFGYGRIILLTPFFTAFPIVLLGVGFLIFFFIALAKLESGGYGLLFLLAYIAVWFIQTVMFIQNRSGNVKKALTIPMRIISIVIFLFVLLADNTEGKFTIIYRSSLQGNFFTKLFLILGCILGCLLLLGANYFLLRTIVNLKELDYDFYNNMGIWRYKNGRLLEDPLKLVLSPTYSAVRIDDDGNRVKANAHYEQVE